jgi:methionine-rich copper-binding protein CopC
MRSNGFIIQPPSGSKTGQVFLAYDHEFSNLMIENANATNLSEIILSSNQQDLGHAIYEAGSLSRFDLKPIRVNVEQSENIQAPIFVSYIFYGSGNEIVSEGEQEINLVQIPESFALNQNYPNPFNPLTKIQYQLPYQTDVNLSIYDILGNEVIVLVHQNQAPGTYNVIWDAIDRNGQQVSGGVYFYRIKTREFTKTKKLILLK